MFGISFGELLLVGLVALLVLGPERLPGAARTAGLWIGRLKRSFNAIKQEVEREIGADEIRRQLHNEHILALEQEARNAIAPPQVPAAPPLAQADVNATPAPATAVAPATTQPAAPAETAPVAEPVNELQGQLELPVPPQPPRAP
ncbi:Sec-independent protein translocase protein TatB [Pseudomonas turukhanskensis]|uniref:Sec-independent protein translocase protein TatB n=1 Tax=Pseudomonas turukhanskensis TaxID=1806536 RepID=A0A9W6K9K9_9PSED|nr:Sec-independent protein translocase protein TatB [Pseudomonas turukhanskensis]GLK91477.1 sec-independent protein translocase protein TatB [Pseudomonas turukhanskensis]